jgi:hypothetical protein
MRTIKTYSKGAPFMMRLPGPTLMTFVYEAPRNEASAAVDSVVADSKNRVSSFVDRT